MSFTRAWPQQISPRSGSLFTPTSTATPCHHQHHCHHHCHCSHPARSKAGLAPGIVQPLPCSRAPQKPNSPLGLPNPMIPLQPSGTGSSAGALRAQLQESQEELLAPLQCREQVATLHAQACRVSQYIPLLCLQQQGEGLGLAQPWQSSGMGMGAPWREAALAEERQKSLELEEYHHSILEADCLLELEVRAILIHRIDVVRGTCCSACTPWCAY